MSAATSLREHLLSQAAVSELIAARMYPDALKQGTELPAIVYYVIDRPRDNTLAGPGDVARTRIQLDCYGHTREEADAVADAVETVLAAFVVPAMMAGLWVMTLELVGPTWKSDPPTDGSDDWRRISMLDVIVHHRI